MSDINSESQWQDDPLWYKDAIIYQLHVKAFFDSNDDGVGDFRGLTEKLDYIQSLGVNTLWLLPFYPSPMRDDGYDIADYRNIFPAYGTRKEFQNFVREAHRRGLKVITELVINHTSDQHPWFQAARRAPKGSAKRNFYVWSDTDQALANTRIIFTDTERSNWEWDPVAKQYYWHRFFSHQPDLNHNNPEVVKAVIKLMRFWFDMGVDGMRLDAIPYLCVREGTNNENLPETHSVLKQMREVVDKHYKNRMFLAEANQWPEDVREYFGDGDECHVAYHFPLMPRMYMAVAQEDRHPITEIMAQTPDIPESCQWAVFLRNHDELTLEMVTDRERDYMYTRYAADPRMRVNVGIRRRLAPLMDNDLDTVKLMNSLLLSMPGSPIIYYGDEIGMGDNIFLGDRNGVRTPMQWSPDRNAGFSRADPQSLYLPPIMDPIYGYQAVNVEAQSREPASLLNWMRRLLAVRKSTKAFGRGSLEFLRPGNRKILAYVREYEGEVILCVANLARSAQPVELDLSRFKGCVPVEMLGHTPFPPVGELPYLLTLPSHGVYWFRLTTDADVPSWHEEWLAPAPLEIPMLVLFAGWQSFCPDQVEPSRVAMAEKTRAQLEQKILPHFVANQRWFAGKGTPVERVEIERARPWPGRDDWLMTRLRVIQPDTPPQVYLVPLAITWGDLEDESIRGILPVAVAKVRQQARVGVLHDAMVNAEFCHAIVSAMGEQQAVPFGPGQLRFSSTAAFAELTQERLPQEIHRPGTEGSNTTVVFEDRLFLKLFRRLQDGLNPELEMGRFLTEVSPFPNVAPLAGALEYEEQGRRYALASLQGYVRNQGDSWNHTLDYLARFLEPSLLADASTEKDASHAVFLMLVRNLGRRTAELHRALTRTSGDPAFDPEPMAPADLQAWKQRVKADVEQSFQMLQRNLEPLAEPTLSLAQQVLDARQALLGRIDAVPDQIQAVKTRFHGDYHLGQVLISENDFIIIDFEGEPARPLAERRAKHSPLRDTAGMIRSFSYAAAVALDKATLEYPERREHLMPLLQSWEEASVEAFWQAYLEAIGDCPCVPAEREQALALLNLFKLEKALYELRYELDNRPDWVSVPLRGLLAEL